MFELITMVAANWLLNLYFLLDRVVSSVLPLALCERIWPLYDWLYRVAVAVSPYDIPPIYEGISHE
jgi:hypothetical protein